MSVKTKTVKKSKSIDENIKHLRSLLSVDTIIDDINQEEALEVLEAIEGNITTEREEMKDALIDAEEELKTTTKTKDEEIEDLKKDYDELMDKTDFDLTLGTIEYRSSGIMDEMIMEALAEAYQWLTPLEIIDRLKIRKLKAV